MKKLKENENSIVVSLVIPISLKEKLEAMAAKSPKYNTKSKMIRCLLETKIDELENMGMKDGR